MPINIPEDLPAAKVLESENVFVMSDERAMSQDIRPLKIIILNLMPTKIVTETQLLRLLGNSPLQVKIELLQMASHTSKNTPLDHLTAFYKVFDEVKDNYYDGMIITGAPVELLNFNEVDYWSELCSIMEWSKRNVYSTLHICWGTQAGGGTQTGEKKVIDTLSTETKLRESMPQGFRNTDNEASSQAKEEINMKKKKKLRNGESTFKVKT